MKRTPGPGPGITSSLVSAVRNGNLKKAQELINTYGLNYSKVWSYGFTLVYEAVAHGHKEVAKFLLAKGCKVNRGNYDSKKYYDNPLHLAIQNCDIEIVKMILDRGADVNLKNNRHITALHIAIENNKMEVVKLLLERGADVNITNNYGESPLHKVVAKQCLTSVELFLKHGAHIDCPYPSFDMKGYTPLHIAVLLCNENIIDLLLSKGADVNKKGANGKTPLHTAVEKGHKKILNDLLEHGANIDDQDKDGKTALFLAVEKGNFMIVEEILKYSPDINNKSNRSSAEKAINGYGNNEKIIEALLEYGLIVNSENANNFRFLHSAVGKGYLKIVKELLDFGANVNISCESYRDGGTLLHTAASSKQEEMIKLLLSYNADINAKDKRGLTPIFHTIENSDLKSMQLLLTNNAHIADCPQLLNKAVEKGRIEILETLLQHGADVNACEEDGRTALHFTAKGNDELEIMKLLLRNGANINCQSKNGCTPLHAAVENNREKLVEILLENKAQVNFSGTNNASLLHLSVQRNNKAIVIMLLENGADVNSRWNGRFGITALHMAAEFYTAYSYNCLQERIELVATLLDYGSDINIVTNDNITSLDIAMNTAQFYSFDLNDSYEYETIAEFLKNHIVKLKAANIYVSEANLQSLTRYESEYHSYRNDEKTFPNECEEEIARMKNEKIHHGNFSFYDILAKCTNSLAKYIRNENLVEVLKSDEYKTKYPIYARMIESRFRMAMKRRELVEQFQFLIFHSCQNNFANLPYVCVEKIVSYLSDGDMKNLVDALKLDVDIPEEMKTSNKS